MLSPLFLHKVKMRAKARAFEAANLPAVSLSGDRSHQECTLGTSIGECLAYFALHRAFLVLLQSFWDGLGSRQCSGHASACSCSLSRSCDSTRCRFLITEKKSDRTISACLLPRNWRAWSEWSLAHRLVTLLVSFAHESYGSWLSVRVSCIGIRKRALLEGLLMDM